ncbi:MAG: magnesium transporter [Gammaproteobacteria bacterium]|nr:magnesium transporter [Gammaproteobacteria bacterium]MCY4255953.1 magnesium transporter [Gammaproteobacteria bacterium]
MPQRAHDSSRREALRALLAEDAKPRLRRLVHSLNPREAALLLESLPPRRRPLAWELVDEEDEGEILVELNEEVRAQMMAGMESAALVDAAEGLALDDLADLIGALPDDITERIIRSLDREDRQLLRSVLTFPPDSAGGIMAPETVSAQPEMTLEAVLASLRAHPELPEDIYCVYVVDRDQRYRGVLQVRDLLGGSPDATAGDLMDTEPRPIHCDAPASDVVLQFQNIDSSVAAVVDNDGRLIGQITADDVVDVLRDQNDREILGSVGLDEEDDMFAPVAASAGRRALWLGLNLVTALVAAGVVAWFKPAVERVALLAVLLPVVASMGGIAGSQTLTLMVRGLSQGRIQNSNARWLLRKELAVGLLNGMGWALVVALVTFGVFSNLEVALIAGAAIAINLLAAAASGVLVPLILRRINIDPALAGGVVLTTITDVIGFAAFLGLASMLLL